MKNLEKKQPMTVIAAALTALLGLGLAADASAQQRSARPPQAQAEPAPATADGVVNVNTASADELMRLPGIGPSKAAAILALRERLSGQRFGRVEDLLRVRGIGRATLRKLRPLVALSGATTLAEPRRGARRSAADTEERAEQRGDDAEE